MGTEPKRFRKRRARDLLRHLYRRASARQFRFAAISWSAACCLLALATALQVVPAAPADEPLLKSQAAATAGPAPFSTPRNSPPAGPIGRPARDIWRIAPASRGDEPPGTLLYDNGEPLDDFGHPASQLSEAAPPWNFIAAAADDFEIGDAVSPNTVARISTVRVACHFFQSGAGAATPTTTWTGGVFVTLYENAGGNVPSGQPNASGGHTGIVVASQLVPMAELKNETLVNECRTAWVVDIPVELYVAKNRRYWVSVVPRFPAPPQSAWVLSREANPTTHVAKVGFPAVGIPFWSDTGGNLAFCAGPNVPPAGSRQDLSFQLYGDLVVTDIGACCNTATGACATVPTPGQCTAPFEVFNIGTICSLMDPPCTPVTGACCDDVTGVCSDGVNIADCQGADQRFSPDELCTEIIPPCGDTTPGACCLPDGSCSDLSVLDCNNMGGQWNAGTCNAFDCPPVNDDCAGKISLTSGVIPFSTLGATTDGPADGNAECPNITNDIWFEYTAECTGTLHVSTCDATDFDSALAVYDTCFCPPVLGPRLACNDDGCAEAGPSKVSLAVTANSCYLIRVGGVDGAAGSGNLEIICIPAGHGACCRVDNACEVVPAAECMSPDVFTADEPCSPETCPPPVNDPCEGALLLADGLTPFTTNGATTDGPADTPDPPCTLITNDVWFNYTASCDGEVTISLCGSPFNAAMAVYDDCVCPVGEAPIACDDDGCLIDGPPTVTFPAVADQCYLVRIGGVGGQTGAGEIDVSCAAYGACCFMDGHCEVLTEADCIAALGTFSGPGTGCTPNNCPQPLGACCHDDGTCDETTADLCNAPGDTFTIDGACTPNLCPGPEGECTPAHVIEMSSTPPVAGAQLGRATALDGDTLVVGAPLQGPSGAAYVYFRSAGVWTQEAMLTPSDAPPSASFGEYVSIDGESIVVGADNAESNEGAAYVFVRSVGVWSEQQKLTVSGSANQAASVAISGDWIMMGSYTDEKVEVFRRVADVWSHTQTLIQPDATGNFDFGYSADIDGDYAVIGARRDSGLASLSGAAYVYHFDGSAWVFQQKIVPDDPAPGQNFGAALSLDGDAIAVAPLIHAGGRTVYVFRRSGATWPLEERFTVSEPVGGLSDATFVSLRGNVVAVGTDSDVGGGSAFIFRRLASGWTELTKLVAPGSMSGDRVGFSVAVDGNTVAVGAPFDDTAASNAGAVHVFDLACEAACCLITGACQLITEPACAVTSGMYQGVGTRCGPNPCPPPFGACCFPDGHCEMLTVFECNATPGSFQGPDTFCDPNPCIQPEGACCLPDGSCQQLDSFDCGLAGGVHEGGGTLCENVDCPQPPECCIGDVEADGDIDLIDLDELVNLVLDPPGPLDPVFCRADINDDGAVNGLDLGAFIELILPGFRTCPPDSVPCCPGDANSDGLIDGRDIGVFIEYLLADSPFGSLEFCVADVNEDELLNLDDADALVTKLLAGDACPAN